MERVATIGAADTFGFHLIVGYGLTPILHHVPSMSIDPAGVWVHSEFVDEARERLLAAGYQIGRRTAPPRGATATMDSAPTFTPPPYEPLGEWTDEDHHRSHEGWRAATRALGNDPDAIERSWPQIRERSKEFRRG